MIPGSGPRVSLDRRAGRRPVGALLVALAVPAGAWAQEAPVADDLGLWRALLVVGDGSPGAVVARADAARASLAALGRELRVDDASVSLMDRIREAGIELDLHRLYQMLPHPAGDAREMRFLGVPQGATYDWTLFPAAGSVNDGRMLAIDGLSRLAPVEQDLGRGKGFAVHQELDVGTGPWRHDDVAALAEAGLEEIEAAARRPATDRARVAALQPALTGDADVALMGAVIDAAPALAATLARCVRVDRIATVAGPPGAEWLDVDFVGRLDVTGLAAMGYPALGRYVDKLDDLVVFDLSLRDGTGVPLAELGFWSAGPGLRVAFTTQDGALLARRKGVPDPTRTVRPTQDVLDLRVRADVEIRAEGMLLRVTDYEVPVAYRSLDHGADVNVPIRSEPKVEFTGQGTVTTWIAELADSALNLETHGQVVFRAVAQGLDGQGSRAALRFDDGPGNGLVSSSMDLFLIDNALVQLGFRIAGRSLTPDDAVVGEALDLTGRLIRDAERDYAAIRDDLAVWDG